MYSLDVDGMDVEAVYSVAAEVVERARAGEGPGLVVADTYRYFGHMASYTLGWYSTIFAFGFSCLLCFMFGYLLWGWALL